MNAGVLYGARFARPARDKFDFLRRGSADTIVAILGDNGTRIGWGLIVDVRGYIVCLKDLFQERKDVKGQTMDGKVFQFLAAEKWGPKVGKAANSLAVWSTDMGKRNCRPFYGGNFTEGDGFFYVEDPWASATIAFENEVTETSRMMEGNGFRLKEPVPEKFEGKVFFHFSGRPAGIHSKSLLSGKSGQEYMGLPIFKYSLSSLQENRASFFVRNKELILFLLTTFLVVTGGFLTRMFPLFSLRIAGFLTTLLGIVVFGGNVTGVMPTIPFLGYVLMTVGGAILTLGDSTGGTR